MIRHSFRFFQVWTWFTRYCWIIYDHLRYLDSVRSKLRSDETLASFLSLFDWKKYTVLNVISSVLVVFLIENTTVLYIYRKKTSKNSVKSRIYSAINFKTVLSEKLELQKKIICHTMPLPILLGMSFWCKWKEQKVLIKEEKDQQKVHIRSANSFFRAIECIFQSNIKIYQNL